MTLISASCGFTDVLRQMPKRPAAYSRCRVIIGHGIDIEEFRRVERLLAPAAGEWIEGAFTVAEREQADPAPNHVQYYAGRYAAKEAVAKALGSGFAANVAWLDVEILRQPTGAPRVRLSHGALALAESLGVTRWLLSISHSGGYAVASAIALAG
jgi:holo-[acyl-carrier protein] synthase